MQFSLKSRGLSPEFKIGSIDPPIPPSSDKYAYTIELTMPATINYMILSHEQLHDSYTSYDLQSENGVQTILTTCKTCASVQYTEDFSFTKVLLIKLPDTFSKQALY